MEAQGFFASGLAVKGDEAPVNYHVSPRNENNVFWGPASFPHTVEPTKPPEPARVQTPAPAPAPVPAPPASASAAQPVSMSASPGTIVKKKRGRPRKYAPDGTVALALSPMPISSSIPLTGEFSVWKRGRGRPMEPIKKTIKYGYETPGENIAYSVGANFTPHVLTVNSGEDVNMKIMSFSQQSSRAICILSATGTISNVTLRQPTTSGGTLTYEGRFEILSLTGSFMPIESGITKSRSGGMSVSLAGPDGRVIGGGLAGMLVAAGPVQVVVGSFLAGHQMENKPKKHRMETISFITHPPHVNSISSEGAFGGLKPMVTPTAFHVDNNNNNNNSAFLFNNPQGFNKSSSSNDTKTSLPEDESRDPSLSNCEVSY